jgi:hypothetical protein
VELPFRPCSSVPELDGHAWTRATCPGPGALRQEVDLVVSADFGEVDPVTRAASARVGRRSAANQSNFGTSLNKIVTGVASGVPGQVTGRLIPVTETVG